MIVGISGKMQSGKDTVASIMQYLSDPFAQTNNFSYSSWLQLDEARKMHCKFQIKHFADKLKLMASLLTGIPYPDLSLNTVKNSTLGSEWNNMTVREFLQRLGTNSLRDGLHPNTWINALFVDYDETCKWIIADTRFKNEAKAIKDRGGLIIRVVRDDKHSLKNSIGHISETDLDDYPFDLIIDNNGTMEELIEKIKIISNENGITYQ